MKSVRKFGEWLAQQDLILCCLLGIGLDAVIEIFSRLSPGGGLQYVFCHPVLFLINALFIICTLSFAMFVKRRLFAYVMISVFWVLLGITNWILMINRTMPFTIFDLQIVPFLMTMGNPWLVYSLTALGFAVGIVLTILLFRASKKKQVEWNKALGTVLCVTLLLTTVLLAGERIHALPEAVSDMNEDSDTYGYVYCFASTLLSGGVQKPEEYGKKQIEQILSLLPEKKAGKDTGKPNVIVLQLESFMDPTVILPLTLSAEATPVFHALKETCESGLLTVPARGGATANVEFEVLSGMSLDFFGPGEYPYQTILHSMPCVSAARVFGKAGYTSSALHNHMGAFYDRFNAYEKFGFDRFVPVEMMTDVSFNPLGWENDDILLHEILDILDATDAPDFIFTVSMQTHGKYPENEDLMGDAAQIHLLKNNTACSDYAMTYYVNQLHAVDAIVGELLEELKKRDEESIVVIYGDHQPAFAFKPEELDGLTLFQTEYVIWSSKENHPVSSDCTTYQLMERVTEKIGSAEEDVAGRLHRAFREGSLDEKTYREALAGLQYDILYGEGYSLDENPLPVLPIACGWHPITLTGVEKTENGYRILGSGFNPYSRVYVDNWPASAIYCSETELQVSGFLIDPGDLLDVRQVSNGVCYYVTESIAVPEDD